MPRGERMDYEVRATPDVAEDSSRSEAPSSTVKIIPDAFPMVDASSIQNVISGKYGFRNAVKLLVPAPFEEDYRPHAPLLKADAPASVPSPASSSVPRKVFQPSVPLPLSRTWAAVVRQSTPAQEEPERPAPSARKQFPAQSLAGRRPASQPPAFASAKNTQSSADGKSDAAELPGPVGTKPYLEGCKSITVWGLSGNVTEGELRSLCSKFGTVTDVNLLEAKADGGLGCATMTFEKASAAQEALSCLQRTSLHGKEIRVGLDSDKDKKHHWLQVWINADVTARKLYEGFLNAGAPCIDAQVVRKPFGEDQQGIGAVAFRTALEFRAVLHGLPLSEKTDWSKHPTYSSWL